MVTNTLVPHIYSRFFSFLSIFAVMLSAAMEARHLRWSSVTKRLVSVA